MIGPPNEKSLVRFVTRNAVLGLLTGTVAVVFIHIDAKRFGAATFFVLLLINIVRRHDRILNVSLYCGICSCAYWALGYSPAYFGLLSIAGFLIVLTRSWFLWRK